MMESGFSVPGAGTLGLLPPGACDTHCHVFGPAARFPYSPDRSYTPSDAPFEQLRALHDDLGISRGVIVQASCHGTDNAAMVDALQRGEGRYAGVCMVDATTTDAEYDRLHEVGVRGVRFNFVRHLGGAPDLDLIDRVVARVAPLGWHLVLHFDAADLGRYVPVLSDLAVPFVIDHMGRVDAAGGTSQWSFENLLALLTDDRCWVKLSGAERLTSHGVPPYDDVVPLIRALVDAAPDRLLWGTDWPHPNVRAVPVDHELLALLVDVVPQTVRSRILVDNPSRLYGFGL